MSLACCLQGAVARAHQAGLFAIDRPQADDIEGAGSGETTGLAACELEGRNVSR